MPFIKTGSVIPADKTYGKVFIARYYRLILVIQQYHYVMDFQKLMNMASKNERKAQKEVCCLFYSSVLRWSIQLWAWLVTAAPARPRMQRTSVIASSQKCPRHGSEGRLGSGPRLVDRIGLGVRVSASFHILSCAVVCAVVQSAFRDTRTR